MIFALIKPLVRSDPIYLFQELTRKASLGVLSVAGNVCMVILAEKLDSVNVDWEYFWEFGEAKKVEFETINEVLEK